jgi:hypothetical protein
MEPCALGSTQPLKMSIPGSKAGRCVRLTTYHLLVPNVKKIRGLNLPDPHEPVHARSGTALFFAFLYIYRASHEKTAKIQVVIHWLCFE